MVLERLSGEMDMSVAVAVVRSGAGATIHRGWRSWTALLCASLGVGRVSERVTGLVRVAPL